MAEPGMHIESFGSFIEHEQDNYGGRAGNSFGSAFSQLERYLRFLEIIKQRHDELAETVHVATEQMMARARAQTEDGHATTEAEAAAYAQWRDVSVRLQLEMESFFDFAYIALTRGAQLVEWYFGPERGFSFVSHKNWSKSAAEYCKKKGLVVPDELFSTLQRCLDEITEPRSHAVVHGFNPRALHGIQTNADGTTNRLTIHAFPTETDTQSALVPVTGAYTLMNDYVRCFTELITTNRDRRYFSKRRPV